MEALGEGEIAVEVGGEQPSVAEELRAAAVVGADPRELGLGLTSPLVAAHRIVEVERGDLGEQRCGVEAGEIERVGLSEITELEQVLFRASGVMEEPAGAGAREQGVAEGGGIGEGASEDERGFALSIRGVVVARELGGAGVGQRAQ